MEMEFQSNTYVHLRHDCIHTGLSTPGKQRLHHVGIQVAPPQNTAVEMLIHMNMYVITLTIARQKNQMNWHK